jgi:hypothetical protein
MPKRSQDPARNGAAQRLARTSAPELVTTTAPAAVLAFLKQAALEPTWNTSYVARVLGVNAETSKRIAAELAAVGYAEPVESKRDTFRNTEAGDVVAGAKEPRLTRATADRAVQDFLNRINEVNADESSPVVRVTKAVAFGGYTTEHQRIQDVEIAVTLEAKRHGQITPDQERDAMKFVKGKGRALKVVRLSGWMLSAPGKVLFDADSAQADR